METADQKVSRLVLKSFETADQKVSRLWSQSVERFDQKVSIVLIKKYRDK